MDKKTALITGASKGIGVELAQIFAENGCNLVLIARSADLLDQLKRRFESEYSTTVYTIVKDLTLSSSAKEVYDEVVDKNIKIDYLVNNAGFGDYGEFVETAWDRYEKMIALNITTLTHLTHLFVSSWKGKTAGKILNVSSTAAFQPGPMMAVYFAGKSFVLNFSEGIGEELKKHNITVTALCPGPTRTHFGDESNMNASKLVKNVKIASSKDVALLGYKSMMKGRSTVIHGAMNKLAPFGVRFMPRKWVTKLSERVMRHPDE